MAVTIRVFALILVGLALPACGPTLHDQEQAERPAAERQYEPAVAGGLYGLL